MSWDSIWEEVFKNQEWGKYPSEDFIRFIARNFYQKERKNTKILEIGCGPGCNIWYLARENFDTYGIDASETAIAKTDNRLKNENLKATLKSGEIINLPFNDNYFDAIIDIECLCCNNTYETGTILKEIQRCLKKGGLFFSKTFTDNMYIGVSHSKVGYMEYRDISDGPLHDKGFVRLIDKEGIIELYGQHFKILSIDKLEYTRDNGEIKIGEWIIISEKKA